MSLKKRAIFGVVVTILLLSLILFAPSRNKSLNNASAGYIFLFWINLAYLAWRERRAANSLNRADKD